jgi:hypothetical protein
VCLTFLLLPANTLFRYSLLDIDFPRVAEHPPEPPEVPPPTIAGRVWIIKIVPFNQYGKHQSRRRPFFENSDMIACRTIIHLLAIAFFTYRCLAAPAPAQLFIMPEIMDKVSRLAGDIKATPINGVYTQCARAGELALTFDE